MKYIVAVTAEHIRRGKPGNGLGCPTALAMQDAGIGHPNIIACNDVGESGLSLFYDVEDGVGGRGHLAWIDRGLKTRINRYDRMGQMKPFRFALELL